MSAQHGSGQGSTVEQPINWETLYKDGSPPIPSKTLLQAEG